MNHAASLRNPLSVFFTLLISINTPLLAEIDSAKKVTSISRQQLQDRSVRVLKQIDVCESILDTLGQSLASGASKLAEEKKAEVRLNLQLLRKEMSIIKDAAAIHINEHQLMGLAHLVQEATRILTAAVHSGLEVIPALDNKIFTTKATDTITLKEIDTLINLNEKRLNKLTELSEKVGLTELNKAYRSARKAYKKYYVWPIIERMIVYYGFINWAIFVTPTYTMKDMQNPENPWRNWLGTAGEARQSRLGKKPFKKTQNISHERYGVEANTDADGNVTYTAAQPHRVDNTDVYVNGKWIDHEDFLKTELLKADKTISFNSPEGNNLLKAKIEYANTQLSDINKAPLTRTKDDTHVNSTSGGGKLNEFTDWAQGVVDMDWTTALIQVPIGKMFHSYLSEDFKVASAQYSKLTSRMDDVLFGTTKKRSYESLTTPDERFSNIVGREEVKTELNKVVEYICSPDKFDRAGIKIERGYLLAGDPQNGKTFMAKALTGEINDALKKMGRNDKMRLFEISTDALISKGIAHYMDLARYHAPCILFLDELDLLRLQRDGDSKLLSEFLTSMSGTLSKDEKSHVIILAATNKPENLDFALRQHGRFGKMFWFDKPTFNHRIEFFKKECEKRCMNISRFDFNELAKQTEGCSFGSLDIVMKKALMLAKFSGSSVTQEHFEKALDSEVKKMIPHGYDVPKDKEEVIAVHQAGKALMSLFSKPQKHLSKVTILPITQDLQEEHVTQQYNIAGLQSKDQRAIRYGGIFSYNWSDSLNLESQDELKKQCKILLAGNIAQTVHGLPSPSYDKIDKQEAFKLAKEIVFEGLEQKEVAKAMREEKLTEAYRLIEQYEREIADELENNKAWLIATTQALQERKTLSVGELKELQEKI